MVSAKFQLPGSSLRFAHFLTEWRASAKGAILPAKINETTKARQTSTIMLFENLERGHAVLGEEVRNRAWLNPRKIAVYDNSIFFRIALPRARVLQNRKTHNNGFQERLGVGRSHLKAASPPAW
jgi:hypothetical protein